MHENDVTILVWDWFIIGFYDWHIPIFRSWVRWLRTSAPARGSATASSTPTTSTGSTTTSEERSSPYHILTGIEINIYWCLTIIRSLHIWCEKYRKYMKSSNTFFFYFGKSFLRPTYAVHTLLNYTYIFYHSHQFWPRRIVANIPYSTTIWFHLKIVNLISCLISRLINFDWCHF